MSKEELLEIADYIIEGTAKKASDPKKLIKKIRMYDRN